MQAYRLILRCFLALSAAAIGTAGATAQQVDTGAAVSTCLAPGEAERPVESFSAERRRTVLSCIIRFAAEQINAQTPLRIDEVTTLESVSAEGTTVAYNLRVNAEARTVDAGLLDQSVRARVCAEENTRTTISSGGAYAYVWRDPNGQVIHRALVDRC